MAGGVRERPRREGRPVFSTSALADSHLGPLAGRSRADSSEPGAELLPIGPRGHRNRRPAAHSHSIVAGGFEVTS